MARTALRSLRILDYQDRELLHIAVEEADNEGWVSTEDLAATLRISHPEGNGNISDKERLHHAHRCVGSRFSYMARIGWVERNEAKTMWRVTEIGQDLMSGRLSRRLHSSLDKLSPGDRILVMRELAKTFAASPVVVGTALRREWAHGTGRRV